MRFLCRVFLYFLVFIGISSVSYAYLIEMKDADFSFDLNSGWCTLLDGPVELRDRPLIKISEGKLHRLWKRISGKQIQDSKVLYEVPHNWWARILEVKDDWVKVGTGWLSMHTCADAKVYEYEGWVPVESVLRVLFFGRGRIPFEDRGFSLETYKSKAKGGYLTGSEHTISVFSVFGGRSTFQSVYTYNVSEAESGCYFKVTDVLVPYIFLLNREEFILSILPYSCMISSNRKFYDEAEEWVAFVESSLKVKGGHLEFTPAYIGKFKYGSYSIPDPVIKARTCRRVGKRGGVVFSTPSGKRVSKVAAGNVVKVLEVGKGWAKVAYGDIDGYLCKAGKSSRRGWVKVSAIDRSSYYAGWRDILRRAVESKRADVVDDFLRSFGDARNGLDDVYKYLFSIFERGGLDIIKIVVDHFVRDSYKHVVSALSAYEDFVKRVIARRDKELLKFLVNSGDVKSESQWIFEINNRSGRKKDYKWKGVDELLLIDNPDKCNSWWDNCYSNYEKCCYLVEKLSLSSKIAASLIKAGDAELLDIVLPALGKSNVCKCSLDCKSCYYEYGDYDYITAYLWKLIVKSGSAELAKVFLKYVDLSCVACLYYVSQAELVRAISMGKLNDIIIESSPDKDKLDYYFSMGRFDVFKPLWDRVRVDSGWQMLKLYFSWMDSLYSKGKGKEEFFDYLSVRPPVLKEIDIKKIDYSWLDAASEYASKYKDKDKWSICSLYKDDLSSLKRLLFAFKDRGYIRSFSNVVSCMGDRGEELWEEARKSWDQKYVISYFDWILETDKKGKLSSIPSYMLSKPVVFKWGDKDRVDDLSKYILTYKGNSKLDICKLYGSDDVSLYNIFLFLSSVKPFGSDSKKSVNSAKKYVFGCLDRNKWIESCDVEGRCYFLLNMDPSLKDRYASVVGKKLDGMSERDRITYIKRNKSLLSQFAPEVFKDAVYKMMRSSDLSSKCSAYRLFSEDEFSGLSKDKRKEFLLEIVDFCYRGGARDICKGVRGSDEYYKYYRCRLDALDEYLKLEEDEYKKVKLLSGLCERGFDNSDMVLEDDVRYVCNLLKKISRKLKDKKAKEFYNKWKFKTNRN